MNRSELEQVRDEINLIRKARMRPRILTSTAVSRLVFHTTHTYTHPYIHTRACARTHTHTHTHMYTHTHTCVRTQHTHTHTHMHTHFLTYPPLSLSTYVHTYIRSLIKNCSAYEEFDPFVGPPMSNNPWLCNSPVYWDRLSSV